MKSFRAPAKAHARSPLPYGTVAHAHRQDVSLLSRMARNVGDAVAKLNLLRQRRYRGAAAPPLHHADGSSSEEAAVTSASSSAGSAAALQPGDILRDAPFFTAASEVAYFSTHPSLCAEVFGFVPGEVLEVVREGGGVVASQLLVVLGARGGKLYVLRHGESSARTLCTLAASSPSTPALLSASGMRGAMLRLHNAHLLHHPHRSLTPAEEEAVVAAAATRNVGGNPFRLEANDEQTPEFSKEQRANLTERVAQLRSELDALSSRAREEAQRVYTAEQRAFLQRAPDLYVAALPSSTDTATSTQSVAATSVYAAVARGDAAARAVVLLTPRIIAATETVGWTGEGDVRLHPSHTERGDVEGSLTASVVL
ncbi:hypothetical protein ABB37_07764 [Leptomonas pyrrhocoris]|uniref:Uncharacterized protein n=1 Tax=Leptomonas pyrrhocoris TaxID=157538 RepID=A0A0N0DSS6_LEPPY|nr:hypothetical protein ABB37_07764 [Leptomonas pyrrhocoris]XP_015654880.1 hypothetical protein ABB37_07764 [Leptomonas pyrrhocoris]KPA76440.1 hypothetical protein ABB37_07764 [Leptomonas pyrrhocoris]KPA76441.1 hypothetical protein ABB37_07764 [Leptomonas pyrrhocoris]|eukprot:XP_015654879.1 hypothetical protein ABB37_07764 [Leptomonas pyrrhocoris]